MSIVSSKLDDLRKKRKESVKKRKNFFPSLVITLLLWGLFTVIILLIDPVQKGALEMFFSIFFLANLFTFALLLANTRRGLFTSCAITLFSFLAYLGVGTLFNLLLIVGALVMFEIYFTKTT